MATDAGRAFPSYTLNLSSTTFRDAETSPGPTNRSILAIKALTWGSGRSLAECKRLVDDVIVELDPEFFNRVVLAPRQDAADTLALPDDDDVHE